LTPQWGNIAPVKPYQDARKDHSQDTKSQINPLNGKIGFEVPQEDHLGE
jgi:hypothetical protein